MGSLCNSNNQTTQTYTPAPQAAGLYSDIINQAQQVASTPYTPYGGQLVAPVNAQQNTGIAGINAAAGQAQPYINTAANYATQGASAITPGQIANYSNPYQQQVINSTLANINETNAQQQQALKGNAISSGAFGGDRAGIAQAELGRQQDLASNQTVAGLNSQNYSQALAAAQADRAAQGQAAYTFGNLGTTAQGAALQGAGAQVQAGTLQQQTAQAQNTADYQQYLQQLAFPYQQTQFLAGVGLPAASGLGGTQTTTPPQPSTFSQVAGLGLAGLSFLKSGGRVRGYASGGDVPFSIANAGGIGWIPSLQIQAPQTPKFGSVGAAPNNMAPLTSGLTSFGKSKGWGDIKNYLGGSGSPMQIDPTSFSASPVGSFDAGSVGGTGLLDFGGLYARGGLIEAVHHLRRGLKSNRYADGGMTPNQYVASGFSVPQAPMTDPAIYNQLQDYGALNIPANADWGVMAPHMDADSLAQLQQQGPVPDVQSPGISPAALASLPPEITAGQSSPLPPDDPDAMAYSGQPAAAAGQVNPEDATASQDAPGGLLSMLGLGNGPGFSKDTRSALLAAGLGIMSGTSPYGLANIGAGGLKGVQEYDTLQAKKQAADLEGKKLAQQLLLHREMSPYQAAELKLRERQVQQQASQHEVPVGFRRTDDGGLEAIPGGPQDPATLRAAAVAKRLPGMDDEALEKMADAYQAGFTGVLANVGRGTQGADNINRFWNILGRRMSANGASGAEIAAAKANFTAQSAAASTAAKREANVSASVEEAKQTFPLVREAALALPRSQFVPWNKMVQVVQAGTSSPELARLVTAIQGARTAYAQAMSRTGVSSVHAMQAADELLNRASNNDALFATLGQMSKEMHAAEVAPELVRQRILERIRGTGAAPASATPAATPAAAPAAVPQRVRQNGHTYERQPNGDYKAID